MTPSGSFVTYVKATEKNNPYVWDREKQEMEKIR